MNMPDRPQPLVEDITIDCTITHGVDVDALEAKVAALEHDLFEVCQLAHKYQNELWNDAKAEAALKRPALEAQIAQAYNDGVEAAAVCVAQAIDHPKAGDIVRRLKRPVVEAQKEGE
jgi:hypothetical protein